MVYTKAVTETVESYNNSRHLYSNDTQLQTQMISKYLDVRCFNIEQRVIALHNDWRSSRRFQLNPDKTIWFGSKTNVRSWSCSTLLFDSARVMKSVKLLLTLEYDKSQNVVAS